MRRNSAGITGVLAVVALLAGSGAPVAGTITLALVDGAGNAGSAILPLY